MVVRWWKRLGSEVVGGVAGSEVVEGVAGSEYTCVFTLIRWPCLAIRRSCRSAFAS